MQNKVCTPLPPSVCLRPNVLGKKSMQFPQTYGWLWNMGCGGPGQYKKNYETYRKNRGNKKTHIVFECFSYFSLLLLLSCFLFFLKFWRQNPNFPHLFCSGSALHKTWGVFRTRNASISSWAELGSRQGPRGAFRSQKRTRKALQK